MPEAPQTYLVLGGVANQTLSVGEGHIRGGGAVTLHNIQSTHAEEGEGEIG